MILIEPQFKSTMSSFIGRPLIEVNRILRIGTYLCTAGTPTYRYGFSIVFIVLSADGRVVMLTIKVHRKL